MFWRPSSRASVYLGASSAVVRYWQKESEGKTAIVPSGDIDDVCGALQTLAGRGGREHAKMVVLLGASEIVLGRVAGIDGLRSAQDWTALIRQRLLSELDRDPDEWTVTFDLLPGGRSVLACGVKTERLQALKNGLEQLGWALSSAEPAALVFTRHSMSEQKHLDGVVIQEPDGVVSIVQTQELEALVVASADPNNVAQSELKRLGLLRGDEGTPVFRIARFTPRDTPKEVLPAAPNAGAWLHFQDMLTIEP